MFIIEFFRDVLDGIWYLLYLIVCIMAFFYVLGFVADRKRAMIDKKLKEKKTYDIESGREAAIAAMETKQILDVNDAVSQDANNMAQAVNPVDATKKEEAPQVLVLNSNESSNNTAQVSTVNQAQNQSIQPVQPVVPSVDPNTSQQVANNDQPKVEEPLVIG